MASPPIGLFTIPKALVGADAIRQRNAIGSWLRAFPGCQVVLFGDDAGVAEVAVELGVEHVPGIECNEYGTPLLSWAFDQAKQRAGCETLGYVNADIIFLPGALEKLSQAIRRGCFIVGQRLNVDLDRPLDFSSDWAGWLRSVVVPTGRLESKGALDYFFFPRETFVEFPPFAVGRPAWDNWMMAQAVRRRLRIVDASAAVLALHQDHGYGHVKNATGPRWQGPEGDRNLNLAGGEWVLHFCTTDMAAFRLSSYGRMERNPLSPARYSELMCYHRGNLLGTRLNPLWLRLLAARFLACGWGWRMGRLSAPGRLRQAFLRRLLCNP